MSLVGSLEDLGLGDILQIVSLARKSGRLVLRTDGEAGWIVLCDGLVRGAAIKGQSDDIRTLLVSGGDVSGDDFDRARELATQQDVGLDTAIVEVGAISSERLDALRRERVERAVMNMFLWRTGEFSFEVRDETDPQDRELLLPNGINTQYLAMEATRLRDEGELLGPVASGISDEEPLFSGDESNDPGETGETPVLEAVPPEELDVAPAAAAVDAMAYASVRSVEDDEQDDTPAAAADDALTEDAAAPIPDADETLSGLPGSAPSPVPVQETAPPPPVEVPVSRSSRRETPPIVAIERDLIALEWFKAHAAERFPRVHIFQHPEQGMDRVRRYLARGVVPLVVASPAMLSVQDTGRDLLERLRSLSPGMAVLALMADAEADPPTGVDAVVQRPAQLGSDPETWDVHAASAQALVASLSEQRSTARRPGRPDAALENLRSVSDRLRDPERSDDVLSVVLEFAARSLARVAVFMLRDDEAMGMAECGMARAGGPDGDQIRGLVLARSELPSLFDQALSMRRGVRRALCPAEDAGLIDLLGGTAASEAYAAPIESGGSPVALVYGDNLPVDDPIGDTTALEIVLHEAGLALDRASLELALAAAQGDA